MKIALFTLNASYSHSSLAIRCLAGSLAEASFDVALCERTLKDKRRRVLEELYELEADIYGFSCYIWNINEMIAMAAQLKVIRPDAVIVFGGPEVSYEDESFFDRYPSVDLILSGEGEAALPALCHRIGREGIDAVKADGRIFRGQRYDGFVTRGVPYERFPTDKPLVYYESSRGCPYSCAYCLSAADHGVVAKDVETVLRELLVFEGMAGVKTVKFVDRTFNFDRERAVAVWKALASDCYTKTYHFEICADLLDEEAFACLGALPAGKVRLEVGVQSIHADTLTAIRRKPDVTACLANLTRLKALGNLHVHADLIAGLPLETWNGVGESFDAVYPRCDVLQLGFLKVLKGSPLEKTVSRYGIVASPAAPYEALRTDALSFRELTRLHRVEEALERFGNSGHFRYALAGVMARIDSPFRFFSALAEEADDVVSLSQLQAFRRLLAVSRRYYEGAEEELIGRMRLDFYIYEVGACPSFLSGGGELPVAPIRRSDSIRKASAVFAAEACEVHRFSFDPEGYYVIDRKHHRCERVIPSL